MAESTETIVIVHGLWMNPAVMCPLGCYLAVEGFKIKHFFYPSMRATVLENTQRLQKFQATILSDTVHWVGHSLGGIIIRRLFKEFPEQRKGRIVTLGTPHQGSQVAKQLAKHKVGSWMLGGSLHEGLLGDIPMWQGQRELGSIVGTLSMGLGQMVTRLPYPNDGTVSVAECQLPYTTDYLELPVAHMSMLFSHQVAQQTAYFLRDGRFHHDG
jgi:pimeloyl-ACP methyl ester carboxylesterase